MKAYTQLLAVLASSLPILLTAGCQSPSGGGYPFQSPARVPPPGTGSYQVPSSYYNNTGGNVSQVYQGGDPRVASQQTPNPQTSAGMSSATVQPAAFAAPASIEAPGAMPATAMPATTAGAITAYPGTPSAPPPTNAAFGSPTNMGVPANTGVPAVNATGMPGASGVPSAPPPGGVAPGGSSATFSDSNDAPSLQWQP